MDAPAAAATWEARPAQGGRVSPGVVRWGVVHRPTGHQLSWWTRTGMPGGAACCAMKRTQWRTQASIRSGGAAPWLLLPVPEPEHQLHQDVTRGARVHVVEQRVPEDRVERVEVSHRPAVRPEPPAAAEGRGRPDIGLLVGVVRAGTGGGLGAEPPVPPDATQVDAVRRVSVERTQDRGRDRPGCGGAALVLPEILAIAEDLPAPARRVAASPRRDGHQVDPPVAEEERRPAVGAGQVARMGGAPDGHGPPRCCLSVSWACAPGARPYGTAWCFTTAGSSSRPKPGRSAQGAHQPSTGSGNSV